MTKGVYSIRDKIAESMIGGLHLFAHDAAAVRFFGDIASDPASMIAKHPADYELWLVGGYDEETGALAERSEGSQADLALFPVTVITGAAWFAARAPIDIKGGA